MKVREFVSKIEGKLRSLGVDDWISPRFIYNESKSITSNLLSKTNNSSRLVFKNDASFTEIEGLPMKEVPVSECLEIFNCFKLMRSTEPLPAIYSGKFGKIINQVASMNFATIYQNANTPRQYIAITKREFKNRDLRYYFFLNGFLYIPILKASEASPEEIRISAMFVDRFDVFQFEKKVGTCEECKKENPCPKLLDFDIVQPDFLQDDIEDKLIISLANVYLKVIPDSNPDLNSVDKTGQRILQNRKIDKS